MQVVIIPLWLALKLEAAKLPLTVVLDTERLSTILSKEDLFFLQKANDCSPEDGAPHDFRVIRSDFPFAEVRSLTNLAEMEYQLLSAQYHPTPPAERCALVYGDVHNSEKTSHVVLNYETVMIAPEVCAVKVCYDTAPKGSASLEMFLETIQAQIGDKQVYELKCFDTFLRKV